MEVLKPIYSCTISELEEVKNFKDVFNLLNVKESLKSLIKNAY